ncbi:MAG: FecR family protein, partial [Syntrophales bacterium]|nr:FecR family protein [Syntrophales bacterium]
MKTNRISMALLLGILLTLLPFTIWAAPVGKITTLEGQADVTVRGVTSPCKIGLEVNEGDIIRTKKQSRVGVTLLDGNVIWVAPLSRLRITQYHPGEGKQNYCDLFRGKTRVVVNAIAKGASLEVHTPTAVAGVRGTIFIGFFERGESGFVFERGSGYGYNRQMPAKVVTIEAGHVMLVPKADQEPIVRPATKQEIERHMKDTTGGEEKPKEKKEAEATKAGEPQKKSEPTPSSETPVVAPTEPPAVVKVEKDAATPLPVTGDVTKKVGEIVQRRVETTTVITTPTNDLVPISVDLGGVAGSLSGSIDDKTGEGTIKFTTTSTTPDFASYVKGSFKDGSVLDAYLGGITGSWQGLFYG